MAQYGEGRRYDRPGRALIAGNVLGQVLDADWTDIEVLIVDLPPGTGDLQRSMLRRFTPDGRVIVSTPHDLALIASKRAIALFDKGGVPIIGHQAHRRYALPAW
jgi:ATP-binding protein involved in chromosome partitioning